MGALAAENKNNVKFDFRSFNHVNQGDGLLVGKHESACGELPVASRKMALPIRRLVTTILRP